MKVYPKLVLNKMKVMGGPTPIYTPLGTSLKEASIEASMYAPTKEAL
jgi:Mor family transcriptional regulator